MFNLFKKQFINLVNHQYKNLVIALPESWKYEPEEEDQEACFDPKSQSTLRINIIKAIPPKGAPPEENIKNLTDNQQFVTTSKGYLLTAPSYSKSIDLGKKITLISWRLVNNAGHEKIIVVFTYTVLTEEKESTKEKGIINLIESSLQNALIS